MWVWVCSRQEKSYGLKLYSGFPEFIKIAVTKLGGSDILSLLAFNTLWDFKRCWNCFVLFCFFLQIGGKFCGFSK